MVITKMSKLLTILGEYGMLNWSKKSSVWHR